jgi:acetylornithine deacetylase/succinyl-diaminopimelate desuccinylase-like protein
MQKWLSAAFLACVCAACGGSGSSEQAAPTHEAKPGAAVADEKKALPEPVYREVTIPAATTLRLDLRTAVASDSSQVEDTVRAALRQAVVVEGQTVLPAGTELVGTVTDVARSGRVKGRARVAYRFSSLRHDSERYDITTATIAHEAEATKKKDATKVAIGAGAGAAIGAILGGGSGAAKGAAIGGGAGTGAVLATRGDEVRRGAGADVNTRLTAPLTVRVKA